MAAMNGSAPSTRRHTQVGEELHCGCARRKTKFSFFLSFFLSFFFGVTKRGMAALVAREATLEDRDSIVNVLSDNIYDGWDYV